MAVTGTASEALGLLHAVQPALRPGEYSEARYLPAGGGPPVRRFYGSPAALIADAARHAGTYNCYFGIATRKGHGGTAADVSRTGTCWADVDAKLWTDAADPKGAALDAIVGFSRPPSVLVDSGGGWQPYWLLAQPLDLRAPGARERLERVNAGLARAVCGQGRTPDHTHDVARIFRPPGTLNHKHTPPRPVGIAWCVSELRYALDEIETYLAADHPWALAAPAPAVSVRVSVEPGPSATPAGDLRAQAAQGRVRRETLSLLDSTGAAGYQSASEADAAIAAALVGAGLTGDEAYTLLRASVRGQDAYDRKGERHGEAYLRRTVQRAADFVRTVRQLPVVIAPPVASPLAAVPRRTLAAANVANRVNISPSEVPAWPR